MFALWIERSDPATGQPLKPFRTATINLNLITTRCNTFLGPNFHRPFNNKRCHTCILFAILETFLAANSALAGHHYLVSFLLFASNCTDYNNQLTTSRWLEDIISAVILHSALCTLALIKLAICKQSFCVMLQTNSRIYHLSLASSRSAIALCLAFSLLARHGIFPCSICLFVW